MSRNIVSNDLLNVRKWKQWPSITRTGNDAFAFSAIVRDLVPSDFSGGGVAIRTGAVDEARINFGVDLVVVA